MIIIGEGEYNLNDLKQIEVTESFLGLPKAAQGCQNDETLHSCTTKHYKDTLLDMCGCLPFSIQLLATEVSNDFKYLFNKI